MGREKIYQQIDAERTRQDKKFGPNRNLSFVEWVAILGEEFGEVSKEAVEYNWALPTDEKGISIYELEERYNFKQERMTNYRKELIEVAAVAVAMIESLDMYHL